LAIRGSDHREIPIKQLGDCAHDGCSPCQDFSAESADISVGGLGIVGWTIAIARTELGREVLKAAESDKVIETAHPGGFPKALRLLNRLTVMKRR
jgi:coenzyme F420 hydrogenase subunit beta